ncbi:hypothetical protein EDD37DRAFT_595204 [Exophiala viscosa]|uniref:Uncharacterized protein n=1 Tax=Exophiala viscosa TaxID=2486360 RepID=A0AAN6I9F5_9EURO|nr:hypothetical protein EDD36DRAFT_84815 [Exophiala viscosa]KAI1620970.1 hypothetical protein EDD37DRAFT_595204 [Exophiala viscosa]
MATNSTSLRYKSFCHTNNDLPTPPSSDTRSDHIPDDVNTIMSRTNDDRASIGDMKLRCCCGRPECAYLENNNTLLGGIERDLETAALLGQALLNRHESYVSESQLEHDRLTTYINNLEKERDNLQAANAKIVEENRGLLDQLEYANTSIRDSDHHVKRLEALLRDCEAEVQKLNGATRRAEELELRILDLEKERVILSSKVEDSQEETRGTIQRWKESVLKVRQLEYEIQKIEWEAKQDRQRHEEIIARLERERSLERELGGAEGRLKGAAAFQNLNGKALGNNNVVSHFVRDILQDNANLQAGIAELRQLLHSSNEEVQNLREQILQHQPVEYDTATLEEIPRPAPLSEQLDWPDAAPKPLQQEVHVHHHYHAKIAGKQQRTPTIRRSSRKRPVFGLGVLPSTPEPSTPSTPLSMSHRLTSSPGLPLTLHQPQPRFNRWSMQSGGTASTVVSSFPSSPRSYFDHSSSIFDRLEAGEDSSRPTSPESAAGFNEPMYRARNYKGRIEEEFINPLDEEEEAFVDEPEQIQPTQMSASKKQTESQVEDSGVQDSPSRDLTPKPSQLLVSEGQDQLTGDPQMPGPQEPEDERHVSVSETTTTITEPTEEPSEKAESSYLQQQRDPGIGSSSLKTPDFTNIPEIHIRPSHHRSSSHDSLVSISGMDIHLAKRPATSTSQSSSFLKGNKAYFALSPSAARRLPSAQALTTVTEFTALSTARSISADSIALASHASPKPQTPERSVSLSVEALSGIAGLSRPTPQDQPSPPPSGFSSLLGGWVRGKWGMAPTRSNTDLKSSTPPPGPVQSQSPTPSLFPGGRAPGINQRGAISGLRPPRRLPSTGIEVKLVDHDSLMESLAE